jgi:outer membrane receptor for ferrienterochelin and colicin
MKQSCVRAFARAARSFALAAVALGFGATALFAQATGKVEGRVNDEAGAPIANASVTIVGTAFTALTNPQGYFFINNVPAGTYEMRAAFIGYRAYRASGVRVLAGQTLTQNFSLPATTVELPDLTVTTTQPLVPRDEVTTKQRVSGEFTAQLPVDRINEALALQPGVVASNSGNTLSIRGGRSDEAATYVDGMPVSPGNRGTVTNSAVSGGQIDFGKGSFEEASITTGASSSEFGNAQSGILNIVTKTGGSAFSGNLSWETDEPFAKTSNQGYNRLAASFGGPLIGDLTFFLSGTLEGNRYSYSGRGTENIPAFRYAGVDTTVATPTAPGSATSDTTWVDVYNMAIDRGQCDMFANSTNPDIADNYGVPCQGARNSQNPASSYGTQAKLNYSYGVGSRFSLLFLSSQYQSRSGINTNANPSTTTGLRNWSRMYQLNWTQNLSKSAERALALDASLSYQQDRGLSGPLTPESAFGTQDKFGGFLISPLGFMFDFNTFPLDTALINNYKFNRQGTRRAVYDLSNVDQYNTVNTYRNSGYGTLGGSESGGPTGTIRLYRENRLVAKAAVDWQFDRYNRLKMGGEHTWYNTGFYSHSMTSQIFSDAYIEKPIRWNAFLEDRLDLGDVVVVGGLRYDVYNTRASRPYTLDTLATIPGTSTANPTFGQYQQYPAISSYGAEGQTFTVNGQALPLVAFLPDQRHSYLSPHVQVAFPVTEKTNFRLSYAHQVQTPDFGAMLTSIYSDLTLTNTNNVFGTDLDFAKTVLFEFGIRHAFNDDMVLDVAAYNKDKLADIAGRLVSKRNPTRNNSPNNLRVMTNQDFGNTRGIDVRLDRRIGNIFNGTVAYSYSSAKNTGSDPLTYISFGSRIINTLSGGNQPPPQAIAPTDESRPHVLAGAFSVNFPGDWREGTFLGSMLKNFGMYGVFRYTSGTAYTKCTPASDNIGVRSGGTCGIQSQFIGGYNAARLPAYKQFDLKFTKGFGLGGMDLTAYLDVRNILNFRNVVSVFINTNDIVDNVDREQSIADQLGDWRTEATANKIYDNATGDIDLDFGGTGVAGCANYVTTQLEGGVPSCIYMRRVEERWGNGDHIFTAAEQDRVADALYQTNFTGGGVFLGDGRRARLGFEINF